MVFLLKSLSKVFHVVTKIYVFFLLLWMVVIITKVVIIVKPLLFAIFDVLFGSYKFIYLERVLI